MLPKNNTSHPNDLRVEKLIKRLSDFSIEADFVVRGEQRVALVGRSGSGKTTLLRILAGLIPLDENEGRILLGSDDLTQVDPQRRSFGIVFQDQALFPGMTVLENVTFGLRMRGVGKCERAALGEQWLEKLQLKAKSHRSVSELSGGERQRVAWARALIWKPRALLLDEPFTALDPAMRSLLRKQLVDLHQEWPVPLLLVTHDSEDVKAVATAQMTIEFDPRSSRRTVVDQSPRF